MGGSERFWELQAEKQSEKRDFEKKVSDDFLMYHRIATTFPGYGLHCHVGIGRDRYFQANPR